MWKNFKNGFIKENPVFGLYLGMCSTLAISSSLDSAVGMSMCVIVVLICSNVIISAMRKIIPDEIRIPVYIVIIASLVTIVQMVVQAYMPELYSAPGYITSRVAYSAALAFFSIIGAVRSFTNPNKRPETADTIPRNNTSLTILFIINYLHFLMHIWQQPKLNLMNR